MKKVEFHDIYNELRDQLQKHHDEIIDFGRELFACPELGFKEVKSNEILTSFFVQNNIPCKNDIVMTGIRADLGSGDGYHIALVADMDAIYARDGEKMFPFHSCGHSIQTAVLAWVMKILKDTGLVDKLGGTVSFIATPAEEFIDFDYREGLRREGKIKYFSGKQNMIEQGIFDDVDCAISMHINGDSGTLFDVNSTLAGFMVKKAVFKGLASHSGAAPHLGRNALHGANLCMSALSYMKDQFPKETGLQLHPVISSCSGSVNIIPEEVVLESYIRANTLEELMLAGEKFDLCAIHSAKALGLECEIKNETGYMPLSQSREINDVIYQHMMEICGDDKIVKNVVSGASGDVGDLGYLIPMVQFGFSGVNGRIHSCNFEIADEENAYIHTAEIVLKTVCDLLSKPELQVKNADFDVRKDFYMKNWLRKEL
ncbi:MAG: M20/M25/M40 family metallo-hydrolase [Lachnospiraceae bacterium]|nr:M20/M25/M40 family metallo-hydrolase [Lachnospiraceae bacterium]